MDKFLAKNWKKIGLFILIVACVFNVMGKLLTRVSFNTELLSSAQFMLDNYRNQDNATQNNTNTTNNQNNNN